MYIERLIKAGKTVEVYRYHTIRTDAPKGARVEKGKPTPDRIKKANLRNQADHLRHLMNANFNDDDFWSLTLTYRKGTEPETIRQVRNDAADFVKRLRKCAKLFGVEVKYIYAIGAGKHRRHIHITVNALPDMAILCGCWTHGHASITKLYSNGQYKDLAEYYMQNAIETKQQEIEHGERPGQMYTTSKNLTKPTETRRVISAREFKKEPRERKGYYIDKDTVWQGYTLAGYPMLRYTLVMLEDRHIKPIQAIKGNTNRLARSKPVTGGHRKRDRQTTVGKPTLVNT